MFFHSFKRESIADIIFDFPSPSFLVSNEPRGRSWLTVTSKLFSDRKKCVAASFLGAPTHLYNESVGRLVGPSRKRLTIQTAHLLLAPIASYWVHATLLFALSDRPPIVKGVDSFLLNNRVGRSGGRMENSVWLSTWCHHALDLAYARERKKNTKNWQMWMTNRPTTRQIDRLMHIS